MEDSAKSRSELLKELGELRERITLSEAFRASPVAMLITRASDARIVDANPSFLGLCGYEREELIGCSAAELPLWHDPTHRADVRATVLEFRSIQEVEASFRRKSGELRNGLVSAELAESGGEPYIIWHAIDITERKRVEAALKRSRERYRSLAEDVSDSAPVGTLILDPHLRVVWVNRSLERYLGIRRAELLGQDKRKLIRERIKDIFEDPEALQDKLLTTYENNTYIERLEAHVLPAPGREERWLQHWSRPIRSGLYAGGRIEQYMDISERKRLEQEHARRAEALEEEVARRTAQLERAFGKLRELQDHLIRLQGRRPDEDVATSVAHSVRNPLTALIGAAQMSLETPSQALSGLKRILQLAWRIKILIDRTLSLFREGTLELSHDNPGRILEEVLGELDGQASAQAVRVEVRLAIDLPSVTADRTLITSALLGIVENALEAMPDGGTLSLGVRALSEREMVAFEVIDTGRGIPEELREKIFQPFFTTKGGGTGLGLSIAQGVIQGHRGRIRIGSRPGGGTIVTVELPMSPALE
jgi:PAS domain S-box-containing protein